MSDDRRKNARLQGRFSNNPKESQHQGKKNEQKNSNKQNSGKNKGGSVKDQPSRSIGVEGINVEYQENSTVSIPELSKKKPEEIRSQGFTLLSETENGKSEIYYDQNFLKEDEAQEMYIMYRESTPWDEKNIIIRGKEYPQPRKVAWYGGLDYAYSGAVLKAAEMPDNILELKVKIEVYLKEKGIPGEFNSVLLNYYRDEHDSVSWHSDDELSMGVDPTIASISLGEVREFHMRPKTHVKEVDPNTQYYVNLVPGSLLVMTGCMQKDWMHQIPKASHNRKGRINLTFRNVYPIKKNAIQVPENLSIKLTSSEVSQPSPVHNPDDFPSLGESFQVKTSVSSKLPPSFETPKPEREQENNQTEFSVDPSEIETNSGPSPLESDSSVSSTAIDTEAAKKDCQNDENAGENEVHLPDESASAKASGSAENVSYQNDKTESDSKAHQFNVNAPDFIPSNPAFVRSYKHMSVDALASLGLSSPNFDSDGVYDFWYHLEEKLYSEEHEKLLTWRDHEELETLSLLVSNGLDPENQKLVNERVCKMIHNSKLKGFNRRSDFSRKPPRNAKGFRNRF